MAPPTCRKCSSFLNKKWGVDRAGNKRLRHEWCCPTCEDVLLCFACCQCEKTHVGWGGSSNRGNASSIQQPRAPAAPAALPASSLPPQCQPPPLPARLQSRSRSREGRRCKRAKIAKALIDQWRGFSIPERPMPTGNRPDAGLVPGATWGEALRIGKAHTEELLRQGAYHSSVHLTLYLEWAAGELRARNAAAQGGLEIGRQIQNFLR
eukprot:8744185-Karenia_brevis.AAC.1